MSKESYEAELSQQLQTAHALISKCQQHVSIDGMNKLKKRCEAELCYLKRLEVQSMLAYKSHLSSSNLGHLQAILHVVETFSGVEQVLKHFPSCQCLKSRQSLVVDVICDHGNKWVKVIAMKAQSLHRVWAGQDHFGRKGIMDHGSHYLHCSRHHPFEYVEPKVIFFFSQGVTQPLQDDLVQLGISVIGKVQPVRADVKEKLCSICSDMSSEEHCNGDVCCETTRKDVIPKRSRHNDEPSTMMVPPGDQTEHQVARASMMLPYGSQDITASTKGDDPDQVLCDTSTEVTEVKTEHQITKVNLDITTVICLISNLCHGNCSYEFQDDVLNRQAGQERKNAVLPSLDKFMEGKELMISETALKDFQMILSTVGGEREKERARKLLTRVTVIPDSPSSRSQQLKESGKIKARPKLIFGTGDQHKAVTMTANTSFTRAAAHQGVNYVVFLHEPRALTEKKEKTATLLQEVDSTTY